MLYRLPTWEELEYATRAGTTTLYYWGDEPRRDRANYGTDRCLPCAPRTEGEDRWLYTSPVGSFPPNPWGLFDMAGNVWQWAYRCPLGRCRIEGLHGGSWLTNPEYLQTGEYSTANMEHRNYHIGFRVARNLNEPSGQHE
jgi:formylglycine-generating enzyme required for sulfatase activity